MPRLISAIGDSISTFEGAIPTINRCFYYSSNAKITGVNKAEDTWWMKVINALDGQFLANASYSGSMVEGLGFPAGSSGERAAQVLGSSGEAPDDILVFYGINDYGWGGAIAQAQGRATNVPVWFDLLGYPEAEAGVAPDNAVALFEEAYEQMLVRLHTAAPDAAIHCITLVPGRVAGHMHPDFCYALRGFSLDEYNDAIARAAQRQHAALVDIRAYGFDYQSSDGTHPDEIGMQQLAAMVLAGMWELASPIKLSNHEDFLESFECTPDFVSNVLFPDVMKSERTCFAPNCIGCEFAVQTGNKWSLVCSARNA